ncbi:MAG: hypothetical protein ABSG24_08525 [Acidimicrobiales bacterium]
MASTDGLGEFVEISRNFRQAERVRAGGEARTHGQPPDGASHHLHDHQAVVALAGRLHAIDGLGGGRDRRVEADAAVGSRHVVVDRFGDAHQGHAELGQLVGGTQGPVAADHDERVELIGFDRGENRRDATLMFVRVVTGRAQDRATTLQETSGLVQGERCGVAVDNSSPSVVEPNEVVTAGGARPHRRANRRVKPRTVAPARQQADPHGAPFVGATRKSVADGPI